MPHGEKDLEDAFNEAFSDDNGNLLIPAKMRPALVAGLVKAVEFATSNATEKVRTVGVRRDIRNVAIITAVIVAAICIPVTYIVARESDRSQAAAQRRDCRLISKIGSVQRERVLENRAATERFRRESADHLGLSPKRFQELIEEGERREARQLSAYDEVAATTC